MKVRGGGRFPNLDRWFDALEQRPAYLGTRSDYFTHVHDLPPQIGGAICRHQWPSVLYDTSGCSKWWVLSQACGHRLSGMCSCRRIL